MKSRVVEYVSIRHTGYETAPDETPSGLNLAGVGNGTTIDKVELFANSDDGFVAIGGTVNVNNIVTSHFNDDGYDCDRGYAGTLHNLIGIGGTASNSSLELDGGEDTDNPSFTYVRMGTQINSRREFTAPQAAIRHRILPVDAFLELGIRF